jgi:hypothetical protein
MASSGWEKDRVENEVGIVGECFFTPLLRLNTSDEMNARLLDKNIACAKAHRRWAIENNLHWTLNVTFDEDQSWRLRADHSAKNMAVGRQFGLNLVRNVADKRSRGRRRKCTARDPKYLFEIVQTCDVNLDSLHWVGRCKNPTPKNQPQLRKFGYMLYPGPRITPLVEKWRLRILPDTPPYLFTLSPILAHTSWAWRTSK